ncbi:MAG: hydrogenase expression/formation protein [Deltaproteobacteria bacterium]|nr:hydrogenase expression/formation protein [Deltaproteobacteria bacterium]
MLPAGKLPIKLLERLLKKYTGGGKRVVVGPSVGIDSAVIDFKDTYLLAKTDPITFVAEDIGSYAIEINANDIAVMGGTPKWFLATLLLPAGRTTFETVEGIFAALSGSCRRLGVAFCGGHTEITPGIDRPIVVGQMLGEVSRGRLITGAGALQGDDIILTKGIAIEAVSVIARTFTGELEKTFPAAYLKRCRDFIKRPGLSVVKDALTACKYGEIHAMHDPTEGGLSTGLYEIALASDCGIIIERAIPLFPETKRLCSHFGLDPMGCIASGALVLTVAMKDTQKVLRGLKKAHIPAWRIGRVTGKKEGLRVAGKKRTSPLKLFERDELTRLFRK